MRCTRVVLAGIVITIACAATPASTWAMGADPAAHTLSPPGSIGDPRSPVPAFGRRLPPRATPAYFDDILAQRVLEPDEKKPKPDEGDERDEPRVLSYKSPWLAMGLSAVLPGAGQFYLDRANPLAFAYAGVEVLSWYLHFQWESDGDEKTREFETYAWMGVVDPVQGSPRNDIVAEEGHWSWERWRESFGQPEGCLQPDNIDYVSTDSTLVHFWFNNRREFYEDIGKYDKYDCGWLGSEFRDIYRSMRNETNDLLERARLMTQVVLLNHLFSSVHAFFLARSHNNRVDALDPPGSGRDVRWQFAPEHDFSGLRAQILFTQRF